MSRGGGFVNDFVMYRDCKKILKYMKRSNDGTVDLSIFENKIKDLRSLVDYLEEYGYIVSRKTLSGTGAEITFIGRRYAEENFISFKRFLFVSVLVPIIISVVVTLLVSNLIKPNDKSEQDNNCYNTSSELNINYHTFFSELS